MRQSIEERGVTIESEKIFLMVWLEEVGALQLIHQYKFYLSLELSLLSSFIYLNQVRINIFWYLVAFNLRESYTLFNYFITYQQ